MNNKKRAEIIIMNVEQMKENSQDMRMWKNIPLAKECVQLLKELDDPAETPMGKALACEAIIQQLPEYDVPRLVLSILHYKLQLVKESEEHAPERYPTEEEVVNDIQRLSDYIDTEHVSSESFHKLYHRHLKADPIERTPAWEENYYEVEKECDRRLGDTPRGMGFCFGYWSTLRQVLAERGIMWRSPSELNPKVMFD
jgi:hypothetical protein